MRAACNCSLKTALVPNRKHAHWRAVMAGTPFGANAVVNTWPYLGAAVTSSVDDSHASIPLAGAGTTNPEINDVPRSDTHAEEMPHTTLVSIGAVVIMQSQPFYSERNRPNDAQAQGEVCTSAGRNIETQATDSGNNPAPATAAHSDNNNANRNPTQWAEDMKAL